VKRVAVVGPGGAGKSTFAKELGLATKLPVYILDPLHWQPGWKEPPRDEWRATQSKLAAGDEWIIEGNYGASFDIRFERADTVIILALRRSICVTRVLRRVLTNWRSEIQAPGCPEHFDLKFLRWVWRYPTDSRPRLDEALARHSESLHVVELKSPSDVRRFLDLMGRDGSYF
jgi:adenylate kinase family enzyme